MSVTGLLMASELHSLSFSLFSSGLLWLHQKGRGCQKLRCILFWCNSGSNANIIAILKPQNKINEMISGCWIFVFNRYTIFINKMPRIAKHLRMFQEKGSMSPRVIYIDFCVKFLTETLIINVFKTRLFSHFSEPCTWILLLFRFPAFELQLEPNSFNVGQKFKLPILTRLSSVRWLAVDLWISEQEINGLNPPLWAKYYSSSSYRKKHLYLEGLEKTFFQRVNYVLEDEMKCWKWCLLWLHG